MSSRTAVRTVERAITVTNPFFPKGWGTVPAKAVYAAMVAVERAADRDESWQLGAAWNAGERAKMLGMAK